MKSTLPGKRIGSAVAYVLLSLGLYGSATALFIVNNESGWYEGWMLYANLPDNTPARDATAPQVPGPQERWPDKQASVLPIQFSMDATNRMQAAGCQGYLESDYQTEWIQPLYELPRAGGIPSTFEAGKIGALSSLIPAAGPSGLKNSPASYGDDTNTASSLGPRDPHRFAADADKHGGHR